MLLLSSIQTGRVDSTQVQIVAISVADAPDT